MMMHAGPSRAGGSAALQRCDYFVGRTTNWLYDHLRNVPRYVPLVLCDELVNREEFPLLQARSRFSARLGPRIWRRFKGETLYPGDSRWLRRTKPQLLHSHFGYVGVADEGLRALLGIPSLVSFYGADVYEYGQRTEWREKYLRLFARVQRVLALGPEMGRQMEALGCPREKIVIHPLGVDVDAIPSRERTLERDGTLHLLFAGTFREKKGIEYVIRGAAAARRRGVRLRVTLVGDAAQKPGDAETKRAVFREIDRLGMEDVVTHIPYVPFAKLVEIALASHVFVAPSVTSESGDAEGTPFVLQQMMATGMPVIATQHSDIPFIFGEHADRLVAERDADAIARRIACFVEDRAMLSTEGSSLRQRIRHAFDVRACAAQLSATYDSLLAS